LRFNKVSLLSLLILCHLAYGESKDNQFKSNNIVINSGAIEVEKKSNKIFFNDGVYIKSGEFTIEARKAIFNKINNIISVYGEPSKISSTAKNNFFTGSAKEIIFTETDKIQLVGNATIYYDDIKISSKEIIFNARNGEVLSNN
jgi:lipopolysaccharide transport protein LptA